MKKLILLLATICIVSVSYANTTTDSIATAEPSLIQVVENWYEENMNYGTITALMADRKSVV